MVMRREEGGGERCIEWGEGDDVEGEVWTVGEMCTTTFPVLLGVCMSACFN